ncbi:myeloid leukemia factor 1 isoform X3 [Sphaeramia orbicularis]|uniref:myeloid leukemia factor 1 isoform X3 n=1 Tax=Sphaeramia orbicularis TaxID=375764 RepID=UPI00117E8594|nr:myeloid leukemia factor 1-like isoform X3 [Sphaeramia orbicularis]
MFNSLRRDFDDDPFFSDPFSAHREHMRQMMRSFSEPFGVPFMPSLMDGSMTRHPSSSQALRDDHRDMSQSLMPFGSTDSMDLMRNPFGMFDGMMANMRNRMDEMHRSFIKETRRALKDSESGVEKMSIGHHIQDRGHVVEKKFNNKTGEREFNQDFQNMDESEAQTFDQEWQQKVSTFKPSGSMSRLQEPKPRNVHQAALTGPEQTHREQRKPKAEGKTHVRIASSSKP